MATSNTKTEIVNSITGKITLKETGQGIPDLLVVLYDLDPGTKPDEFIKSLTGSSPGSTSVSSSVKAITGGKKEPVNTLGFLGDRIGSVLTVQDGSFIITYVNQEFQVLNEIEKRPDLFLLVLGPEESQKTIADNLLYYSPEIRQNAGRSEFFFIQLTEKQLIEREIKYPKIDIESLAQSKFENYNNEKAIYDNFHSKLLEQETKEINGKKEALVTSKNEFRKLLAPKPIAPDSTYSTFVDEDKVVADKLDEHIRSQINKRQTAIQKHIEEHTGIEVSFVLNPENITVLGLEVSSETNKSFNDINNSEPLKNILYKMNAAGTNNLVLTSNNPIIKKCIAKTDDTSCAAKKLDLDTTNDPIAAKETIPFSDLPDAANTYVTGNHGGEANVFIVYKFTSTSTIISYEVKLLDNSILQFDSNGDITYTSIGTPLTTAEIATHVKKVISDLRSLKEKSDTKTKPDQNSVNDNINNFSLKKGPAEQASFFDFHILNIAFGHIWQQIIDDTPAQLAAEAKEMASKRGYAFDNNHKSKNALLADFKFMKKVLKNPPQEVVSNFDITYEEWNSLELDAQTKLRNICIAIDHINKGLISSPENNAVSNNVTVVDHRTRGTVTTVDRRTDGLGNRLADYKNLSPAIAQQYLQDLRLQGDLILDYMRNSSSKSFHKILTKLDRALKSNYAFNIFGADDSAKAINFGLMNTYRQKWEPVAYQVGDLVKSIPLSPKEEMNYSLKTTFNRKRTEKEAKKNNTSLTQEQNTTSRAEEEIVSKANNKSDFKLGAEGSYGSVKVTSSLGLEAAKESSQNKKDFRESVLKATQDYKEERSVEIDTEESSSAEYTTSGKIVNPNDELAVTYLFYELQKRFKVSEQLYRVMPVVLVAQDVPAPNEITESWVIAHDWILNRVLLDDSFRQALQYIAQKNVGDDFSIREYRRNLRTQHQLVETLQRELAALNQYADNRYQNLLDTIKRRVNAQSEEESDGWFETVGEFFGGGQESAEAAKAREMAARDEQAYAADKAQKTGLNLQREVNALQSMTADYNKALRDHLDKKTMVGRLLLHIKNNIIYYMQAIWSMEPPDQRFMRLLNVKVPQFEIESMDCEILQKPEDDLFKPFRADGETLHKAWIKPVIKQSATPKTLVEVADLDSIIGFKGNYIAFPMKQHNALTEIMAMPYVDASFGAMDPDQLSNVSLEDYSRYVCCLRQELSEEDFNALKDTLKGWLEMLLADPLRNGDEIIVPTTSLYIEMLVSANSLLEDFKLKHREWDVYKVQQEVQMAALENLRLAQRILDKQLEDPKIDKKIVVEGNVTPSINVDNN